VKGRTDVEHTSTETTRLLIREISSIEQTLSETHPDVVIDFSNPANARTILRACKKSRTNVVFCTTGFSEADLLWMTDFALHNKLGVVFAPNVTLGVNVLLAALKLVARALPSFDYHITETHHSKKYDIPSGTAKKLAAALLKSCPGSGGSHRRRPRRRICRHATVLPRAIMSGFSLTHESFTRRAFVEGALTARSLS
jgi:4-hydroxy-tetrahydrodipicolinate reductase